MDEYPSFESLKTIPDEEMIISLEYWERLTKFMRERAQLKECEYTSEPLV
jgi:hypothetical protein